MKRETTLAAFIIAVLLDGFSPLFAATPQGYGVLIDRQFVLGWVLAECNLYRENMIPASRLSNTFSKIGLDRHLSDATKFEIFQIVQEFHKCAEVFHQWSK